MRSGKRTHFRGRPAMLRLILLLGIIALTTADIYMHNPRGSNNRLHGAGTNAGNERRLFDSQNNAKGGYNQGYMFYYSGSILPIEWTNQHGAGLNALLHSQIVIQYMCDDNSNPNVHCIFFNFIPFIDSLFLADS